MNKLIVVANTKGGCGKSTLVMCLAAEASARNIDVVLVDADPTSILKFWAGKRKINCVHVASTLNVSELLIKLKTENPNSLILVDTGGFDSKAARSAIVTENVNTVIFPVKTSPLDLFVTRQFLQEALPYLKNANCVGVVMEADHLQSAATEILKAKDVLSSFGIKPIQAFTVKRKEYRKNFLRGGDHLVNEKAKKEVSDIFDELVNL
ncbi:ParA family protein [Aliivibrio wodanis]|uniref:ParA family protein n=1 Tax=Aliivibrio wodanis TaxID=80852 RepID=UPI00406D346F